MMTLTASAARAKLYKLLDHAASSHEPVQITGKRANAVLISGKTGSEHIFIESHTSVVSLTLLYI